MHGFQNCKGGGTALFNYTIRTDCDIPFYKQLVDAIHADVCSGKLPAGAKLPTVRELSDRMGLARGTIKRAYDELGSLGDLEMSRGRGTFVRYRRENSESRKERAMAAIDHMLDALDELGFSAQETDIFLKLKLQERALRESNFRVALVECNQEVLMQLLDQLHALPRLDLYQHLVTDVVRYPYEVAEEMDLIVTTASHYASLCDVIPDHHKLVKVALRLTSETILSLAKLPSCCSVGVLCHSERFGLLLQDAISTYAPSVKPSSIRLFGDADDIAAYLSRHDAVLAPYGYERLCSRETRDALDAFRTAHTLIPCCYQIDQGSYLHLEERVQSLISEHGMPEPHKSEET